MANKVVLILVDGMRPDGVLGCGHPFVEELRQKSSYDLSCRTVMPSVTLPCHMSLFHSVDPDRHGILSNTYVPQVRPIVGLFDQLAMYRKNNGFFYTWEELRDLCRLDRLHTTMCLNLHRQADSDDKITDAAIRFIEEVNPDFTFLYLGMTDAHGHGYGWMSEQYLQTVNNAWACIERVYRALPEDYTLIVTADHGGHDRSHGSEDPQDMNIPLFLCGASFAPGRELTGTSIKDIAPTITALLDVPAVEEWEGTNLLG